MLKKKKGELVYMVILEPFECRALHRRVKFLTMDGDLSTVRLSPSFNTRYIFELVFQCHRFEVNQYPVAEVMPVLLKSCQSASQEEAVEEMKDC